MRFPPKDPSRDIQPPEDPFPDRPYWTRDLNPKPPPAIWRPVVAAMTCAMVAVLILGAAGSIFSGVNEYRGWTAVEGKMLSGSIEAYQATVTSRRGSRIETHYRVHIEYEYVVGGTRYKGNSPLVPPGHSETTSGWATGFMDRHPVGAPTRVYFDPADPARSYLELASAWGGWLVVVLACVPALAAAYIGAEALRRIAARRKDFLHTAK